MRSLGKNYDGESVSNDDEEGHHPKAHGPEGVPFVEVHFLIALKLQFNPTSRNAT